MAMFDPHSGKLQQVREVVRFTPLQQDVLKFLALVLMVVDHANRSLGLHEPALLLLGRGAFPLFALLWGYNLAERPVRQVQATRLWLWAVIAQPGYALVMQHDGRDFFDPNILFLFAVVTQVLVLASRPMSKGSPNPLLVGVVLLALWGEYGATDGTYGIAGVLVLLASYGLCVSLPGYVTAVWPVGARAGDRSLAATGVDAQCRAGLHDDADRVAAAGTAHPGHAAAADGVQSTAPVATGSFPADLRGAPAGAGAGRRVFTLSRR